MSAPIPGAKFRTREEWLDAFIAYQRPLFEQLGFTLPETIHISVGMDPSGRTESRALQGSCISGVMSADGAPHLFISPGETDPIVVCTLVTHLLGHAVFDPHMDHNDGFKELMRMLGMEGRMHETTAGPALAAEFVCLADKGGDLGPYPHPALEVLEVPADITVLVGVPTVAVPRTSSARPKQTGSRWVTIACPVHAEAGKVRTTQTRIDRGAPLCGEPVGLAGDPCGHRMAPTA